MAKQRTDVTISVAAMRILKLLVGKSPQTVANLIEAAGVTRTAVTEQLNELEEAGLIERTVERLSGRGRPRNRFRVTKAALLLLASGRDSLLGQALWGAVEKIGGEMLRQQILDEVTSQLADQYQKRITAKTPLGRLRQMNKLLCEEGALIDLSEENGDVFLFKRTCPFIGMYEEHQMVCSIDENIIAKIVGKPVRRVSCRHDGDPCCVFQIDKT